MLSTKLRHLKQFKVESESKQKFIGTLVTGTVVLPNLNLLAVTTTGCNVTCYDLSATTKVNTVRPA